MPAAVDPAADYDAASHDSHRAMLFKLVIAGLLIAIVISLFSGLVFLMKDSSGSKRTVRALTVRVALSATLIILLIIGTKLGWIHPHNVGQH